MKTVSVLLAIVGVAVAMLLLAWFDVGAVVAATLSIGWGGFAVLLAWQGATFLLLASAWRVIMPGVRPSLLVWGRMVRDAATTCLPFSPVGGFVIGARALTLLGVSWPTAAAGTVVDVTAEITGQVLYAMFGAGFVLLVHPGEPLLLPVVGGIVAALGLLAAGLSQRVRIGDGLRLLGTRLLGGWFGTAGGVERLQAELGRLYDPRRLILASMVHLSGWFATGVGTWIALHLLGASAGLLPILALEALLDGLVAAAFVVPGAAGVQEAGYVGIGAWFGVPPDLALGASLLRRAKDLAWGLPILAAWQWRELRRLAA